MEKPNEQSPRPALSQEKQEVLDLVKVALEQVGEIESARAYGSWFSSEQSPDLDIATFVAHEHGVVPGATYEKLLETRGDLATRTGLDIDLVPHTDDEIKDIRSPIYHPRYNPSLVAGKDLKGALSIPASWSLDAQLSFGDITANTLLDNRTICRRQLVRSLRPEEGRIFASKLLHGPGNALTYYACQRNLEYIASPSDWFDAIYQFDATYGANTEGVLDFLRDCRQRVDLPRALKLMEWYEHLTSATLGGAEDVARYNAFCANQSHD